jgi:hypothetical protein
MNTHFKPSRLSSRLSAVRRRLPSRGSRMRRQGRDVIGRSQGEPDFALYLGAQQDDELQGVPRKNHGINDCNWHRAFV